MATTEVVLRAYRAASEDGNPDLELTATDGEFKIVKRQPQPDESQWPYSRIKIFLDNVSVLILPTLPNGDGKVNRDSKDRVSVVFHCDNLLGGDQTTFGLKLRLKRLLRGQKWTTGVDSFLVGRTEVGDSKLKEPDDDDLIPLASLAHYIDDEPSKWIGCDGQTLRPCEELKNDKPVSILEQLGFKAHEAVADAAKVRSHVFPDINSSPTVITLKLVREEPIPPNLTVGGLAVRLPHRADAGVQRKVRISQIPSREWITRESADSAWSIQVEFPLAFLWNPAAAEYERALVTARSSNRASFLPQILSDSVPCRVVCKADRVGPRWRLTPQTAIVPKSPNSMENTALFSFSLPDLVRREHVFQFRLLEPRIVGGALSFSTLFDEDKRGDNSDPMRVGSVDLAIGGTMPSSVRQTDLVSHFTLFGLNSAFPAPPRFEAQVCLPVRSAVPAGQDAIPGYEFVPQNFSCETVNQEEEEIEKNFRGEGPIILSRASSGTQGADKTAPSRLWVKIQESNPVAYTQSVSIELHAAPRVVESGQQAANTPAPVADKKAGKAANKKQQNPKNSPAPNPPAPAVAKKSQVLVLDPDPFLVALVEFTPFADLRRNSLSEIVARWTNGGVEGASWQVWSNAEPFRLALPPQGIGEEMPKAFELKDKDPANSNQKPLDYRFSPPAYQTLQASYTPQNYTDVPWDLRRIMGYVGQRDAGAGVVQLQYELLYGLACTAETPFLRLAEIFATLGRIPGRLSKELPWISLDTQKQIYRDFRKHWSALFRLLNSHVAVFEPRKPGPNYGTAVGIKGASTQPEVLTLSDGVACDLRKEANLYYPNQPDLKAGKDVFPVRADGLKGGTTWGFEAPRLYYSTVQNPHSVSARLTNPYFSALGGWGFQKASFDVGLSSIYSNTSMGRSFFYSLERLGRIGVYHNLAKHVIVYERSVLPSKQFYREQTRFAGRPVLRKVREFIEVLEPKLTLSRQGTAPSAGCVKSIEFKSRIMFVNSTWGSNVGSTGWKIPLWNRAAAQENPDVYGRPEICLNMAGAEGADVEYPIADPEKLVFYTDTQEKHDSDPKAWDLVDTVDFVQAPVPTANPPFPTASVDEAEAHDMEIPVGLRGFTLTLEDPGQRANLSHGRADDVIGCVLKTVTMVRPVPGEPSDFQKELGKLLDTVRSDLYKEVRSLTPSVKPFCDALGDRIDEIDKGLRQQAQELSNKVKAQENQFFDRWKAELHKEIDFFVDDLARQLKSLEKSANDWKEQVRTTLLSSVDSLYLKLGSVAANVNVLARFCQTVESATNLLLAELEKQVGDLKNAVNANWWEHAKEAVAEWKSALSQSIARMRSVILAKAESWIPGTDQLGQKCETIVWEKFSIVEEFVEQTATYSDEVKGMLCDDLDLLVAEVARFGYALPPCPPNDVAQLQLDVLHERLTSTVNNLFEQWSTQAIDDLLQPLSKELMDAFTEFDNALEDARTEIQSDSNAVVEQLLDYLTSARKEVDTAREKLCNAASKELEAARRKLEECLGRYVEVLVNNVAKAIPKLPAAPNIDVSLLRAFGRAPEIPNLGFSLPNLAYYFRPGEFNIDLTPVLTKVKELGNSLGELASSPLGTKLPSFQLLGRPIPPLNFPKFDLSSVLPDFGGLKLQNLFPSLKMPQGAADHIKISHGFDKAANRAWVQADIDFETDGPATLFAFGPLKVALPKARFQAQVRMEVDKDGQQVRRTSGSISGDWEITVGGTQLVVLERTALTFDDSGHIHFSVSPDRVKLSGSFKFIEAAISKFSSKGNGFSIHLKPTSVETVLALPIPDFKAGTTGITNLSISTWFGVEWANDFNIKLGFSLARKDAPFNLSVFILGGGGYALAEANYAPSTGKLTCRVSIAITASASLGIAVGPIKGSVAIFVGFTVEFDSGSGTQLTLGLLVIIRGEVSILGIVSAYVGLRLEANYSNGKFTGVGTFSVSIKICWCFTLEINESITYTVGGSGTSSLQEREPVYLAADFDGTASDVPSLVLPDSANDDFSTIAKEYIGMFA